MLYILEDSELPEQLSDTALRYRTGWSEFRIPAGAGNYTHQRVQIDSGAQTASYATGTRDSLHGVKRPDREADHSPPSIHLVPRSTMRGAIPSFPQYAFMA